MTAQEAKQLSIDNAKKASDFLLQDSVTQNLLNTFFEAVKAACEKGSMQLNLLELEPKLKEKLEVPEELRAYVTAEFTLTLQRRLRSILEERKDLGYKITDHTISWR